MSNNPYEASRNPAGPAPTKSKRSRRYTPPTWVWVVVVLSAAIIALLQFRAEAFDQANVNIATFLLTLFSVFAGVIWFFFFSAYSATVRRLVVAGGVAALILVGILFRLDHLDGALIPRFRPRWSLKPDERLAKPVVTPDGAPVDLVKTTREDFPQFLGPQRSAHLGRPSQPFARDWQAHPPKLLWRQEIGAGWSAFSAVNGFAVTMEQRGADEMVTCYDARTGELKWWHSVTARHFDTLGGTGPRSTPTIHAGKVYALGATGVLHCLDGVSGKPVWPSQDLLALCGSTPKEDQSYIKWGRSGSPLIVENLVVVPLGGKGGGPYKSLIAFDKNTGAEVWRGGDRNVSYSSPTLATLLNVPQILSVNEDNVSSHDPKSGQVLWSYDWPGSSSSAANSSQVVPFLNDMFFLSKAYGGGGTLVRLKRDKEEWTTEPIWQNRAVLKTKFTNVVIHGPSIFGLSDGILECVDLQSGQREWKQGRYGQGQILGVDDVLLVQEESGGVVLCQADAGQHQELARLDALEGVTWNNLCLHGRLLLVRNATEAACYELPAALR